ncbi:TetR/AcrR family transcriptional regulator [Pendulispora albinea]|uniref:TetR/AcrR family transcriptional regulator n=1 Tax=Pendulispora albinea TaxID=2741071 RepID=A0ABZ2LXA7_9BACT
MRLSKEQAARNRQGIIDAAARLFRERGIDGVGVADLMKAAGFTHGGFYNHFPSKEALAAEACASAFENTLAELNTALAAGAGKSGSAFSQYLAHYLSPGHRDDPNGGCPMASFAVDAWRQGDEVQSAYAEGIESVLSAFATQLAKGARGKKTGASAARVQAIRLLSEVVGALLLARAVAGANAGLSDEILEASRQKLGT